MVRPGELLFYVLSLLGVGLWTIVRLGAPGLSKDGAIPFFPERLARGLTGRLFAALLVAIGVGFVLLALAGVRTLLLR
jgi:hypothetical protein